MGGEQSKQQKQHHVFNTPVLRAARHMQASAKAHPVTSNMAACARQLEPHLLNGTCHAFENGARTAHTAASHTLPSPTSHAISAAWTKFRPNATRLR
jgi:hypothetical protein